MIFVPALFDELEKIGNEAVKTEEKDTRSRSILPALRAMAVGAGGGAIGFGLAELAGHYLGFFNNPHPGNINKAKMLFTILGGASTMLADRYRQRMNEEYNKVKGYGDRGKK